MGKNKEILLMSAADRSFVDKDEEILERKYDVTRRNVYYYDFRKNPILLFYLLRDIWAHDLIFGWFIHPITSIATILGAITNTPSVLIAGGYDVARVPEIDYGQTLNPAINILTKLSIYLSDAVLAVSDHTRAETQQICSRANVKTIYVGAIDTDRFNSNNVKNEGLIITTGTITKSTLYKKGLLPFAQASAIDSDNEYVIIGKKENQSAVKKLCHVGGDNLSLPGYVSDERLLDYYKRANIYVQASKHESFGVALAEAMSCKCIPVVSQNGALPEVVGDTGIYLDDISPKNILDAITKAKDKEGIKARNRITNKFHILNREKELLKEIDKYV
jgi:glycosyltransferase involved in cell wall biosynthesis